MEVVADVTKNVLKSFNLCFVSLDAHFFCFVLQVSRHERRLSQIDAINEMPLYPTEQVFDPKFPCFDPPILRTKLATATQLRNDFTKLQVVQYFSQRQEERFRITANDKRQR